MANGPQPKQSNERVLLLASERKAHAFNLPQDSKIVIGRHATNDLQLDSRTISGHHAEFILDGGDIVLRDLNSTNGTFVNGEPISSHRLENGDEIRISNYVFTVYIKDREQNGKKSPSGFFIDVGSQGNIIPFHSPSKEENTQPFRDFHDLSLPDLLMFLFTTGHTVTLVLYRGSEEGRILLHNGSVIHAVYQHTTGEKALYRLFGWQEARYEVLKCSPEDSVKKTITLPTESLIKEGVQQLEDMGNLADLLPHFDSRLRLREGCSLPLSAFSPGEVEVYQLLIQCKTIEGALEESNLADFRILRLVHSLIRKNVFEVSETHSFETAITTLAGMGPIGKR